jgi:broad specificity phosphatase PhoE
LSELYLIRHGQATPFEADTDQLSVLGEAQARVTGEALVRLGAVPTRVLHGPLVRQTRSAEVACAAAHTAGADWPTPELDPRWAEYDGDGLIETLGPLLAERDPVFAALRSRFAAERYGPDPNRPFQAMLEYLTGRYLAGEVDDAEVESWAAFRGRVREAVTDLVRGPPSQTVLAFTSGGVIGVVVAGVLQAPDQAALTLNWRVRNASITRLTYGGGRISLDSFNETSHLEGGMMSWR